MIGKRRFEFLGGWGYFYGHEEQGESELDGKAGPGDGGRRVHREPFD